MLMTDRGMDLDLLDCQLREKHFFSFLFFSFFFAH